MRAINLKTEHLTDPIGIDIEQPYLSWNCSGGKKQTAYEIEAVSDEIKRLRESLEICDSVEQRAEQMKNELDEIQYETEKEVESDELFGRSSGTGREDVT